MFGPGGAKGGGGGLQLTQVRAEMAVQCGGRAVAGSGGGGEINEGGGIVVIAEHVVMEEVGAVQAPSVVVMRSLSVSMVTNPGGNGGGAGGGDGNGGGAGGDGGGGHVTGAEGTHCPPWLTHTDTTPEMASAE